MEENHRIRTKNQTMRKMDKHKRETEDGHTSDKHTGIWNLNGQTVRTWIDNYASIRPCRSSWTSCHCGQTSVYPAFAMQRHGWVRIEQARNALDGPLSSKTQTKHARCHSCHSTCAHSAQTPWPVLLGAACGHGLSSRSRCS